MDMRACVRACVRVSVHTNLNRLLDYLDSFFLGHAHVAEVQRVKRDQLSALHDLCDLKRLVGGAVVGEEHTES